MIIHANSDEGFFKELHLSFRRGLDSQDLSNFKNLSTDEERFKFVLNLQSNNYLCNNVKDGKCLTAAKDLKNQGNIAFQGGAYNVSLYFYTNSLLQFPMSQENSEEYSIIRANRSAALYHLEKYKEAIQDIETALRNGYPKHLLYKVKDRKARCLLALKQHKSALKIFKETLIALDDTKLDTEKKLKWQRDVQIMIAMMSKLPQKDAKSEKKEESIKFEKNPSYECASKAVNIKKDETFGRYGVANRNIKIGDILVVEKPYCSVLLQEFTMTNCFECFKRIEVGEPCPTCSRVVFCSEDCMKSATETHHPTECKILPTLWSSGISVTCLMAIRMITQNPPEFFTNIEFLDTEQLWEKKKYQSSDYNTVYNLVGHEYGRKAEDLFHRAHVAVFLFHCLKAGGYFSKVDNKELEFKIGGLLMRHLQIVQFNAHEVSELQVKGEGFSDCTSVFIGGAIYPTLALLNHSCNPSIVRYFNGTTVIARAVRDLKNGEEIAENYGPIFTQVAKKERQATLKNQYWFDCLCEACQNDWPLLDEMDNSILPFRCDSKMQCQNIIKVPVSTLNFMVKCTVCGQTTNIVKGLKVLQDTETIFRIGMAYLDEGDATNGLKKLTELYHLVNNILAPPFKDIHLCQQAIRTCYLTMGNISRVKKTKTNT